MMDSKQRQQFYCNAVTYNNAGCKQMEARNYKRASKLFTMAFHSFKKAYNQNGNQRQQEAAGAAATVASQSFNNHTAPMSVDHFMKRMVKPVNHHHHHQEEHQTRFMSQASGVEDNGSTTASTSPSLSSTDDVVVYNWPISVPAAAGAAGVSSSSRRRNRNHISSGGGHEYSCDDDDGIELQRFRHCFPTIIVFNLALSHHLLGMQTHQTSYLRKAICFYESSFRFEKMRCKQKDFVSPFLLVTILSNLGHIKRRMHQLAQAEGYFQKLFSILTYLVQVKRVNASDYSAFFDNIAIGLHSKTSIQCAGAA